VSKKLRMLSGETLVLGVAPGAQSLPN